MLGNGKISTIFCLTTYDLVTSYDQTCWLLWQTAILWKKSPKTETCVENWCFHLTLRKNMSHTCRLTKKQDKMPSYYLVISNVSAPVVMSDTVIPFTGGFSLLFVFPNSTASLLSCCSALIYSVVQQDHNVHHGEVRHSAPLCSRYTPVCVCADQIAPIRK